MGLQAHGRSVVGYLRAEALDHRPCVRLLDALGIPERDLSEMAATTSMLPARHAPGPRKIDPGSVRAWTSSVASGYSRQDHSEQVPPSPAGHSATAPSSYSRQAASGNGDDFEMDFHF